MTETAGTTSPMTAPEAVRDAEARHQAFTAGATVASGVATQYWLELLAYPPGSARSLWLFVDNAWRHLDNPSDGVQASVQPAFCECADRLEVVVWYSNDVIVGLVVRSR